jgi:hypothetical protein
MSNRSRALLIGSLGGALVGFIGAWFYLRSAGSDDRTDGIRPSPVELLRLGLSIVGIVRQITALGRMRTV